MFLADFPVAWVRASLGLPVPELDRVDTRPATMAGQVLCQELLVWFGVAVGLGEVDAPMAIDRDAVARVRQVFGGQPEVDRVLGDVVEREPGREPRGAGALNVAPRLATLRPSGNSESSAPQ